MFICYLFYLLLFYYRELRKTGYILIYKIKNSSSTHNKEEHGFSDIPQKPTKNMLS